MLKSVAGSRSKIYIFYRQIGYLSLITWHNPFAFLLCASYSVARSCSSLKIEKDYPNMCTANKPETAVQSSRIFFLLASHGILFHASPRTAMQVQWAQQASPLCREMIQQFNGEALLHWECRTCRDKTDQAGTLTQVAMQLYISRNNNLSVYIPTLHIPDPTIHRLVVSFMGFTRLELFRCKEASLQNQVHHNIACFNRRQIRRSSNAIVSGSRKGSRQGINRSFSS